MSRSGARYSPLSQRLFSRESCAQLAAKARDKLLSAAPATVIPFLMYPLTDRRLADGSCVKIHPVAAAAPSSARAAAASPALSGAAGFPAFRWDWPDRRQGDGPVIGGALTRRRFLLVSRFRWHGACGRRQEQERKGNFVPSYQGQRHGDVVGRPESDTRGTVVPATRVGLL